MRLTMNVDCTPEEARSFLGLPDISELNAMMVERVKTKAEDNLDLLDPNEMMKGWMNFGGMMQEQFAAAMTNAATSTARGDDTEKDE